LNVYQYIANNNPDAAYEVCKSYGYQNINNLDDLSHCLEMCVANDGKEAFKNIMELHPDKDALVELFTVNNINQEPLREVIVKETIPPPTAVTVVKNADGGGSSLVNKTNLYILGGAALIAFTILLSKK
jgi:hypothetical protein